MNFDQPSSSQEVKPGPVIEKNEKGQVHATPEEIEEVRYLINIAINKEINKEIAAGGGPGSRILEHTQGVSEFQEMVAEFEATYSLEELSAITDLTADPDRKHPLRDPAKEALKPILAKLDALKKRTDIPDEKYEELKSKWKILSRAVGMVNKGMVNKGMVDHTR